MSQNVYIHDRVVFEKTTPQSKYDSIISWLKQEKKVRIIEAIPPLYIKFYFEKDFGFFGFGEPFIITIKQEKENVVIELIVPFPKSHIGLTDTPLIAHIALEDIYRNIGVNVSDEVLERIFPKNVINEIVKNKLFNLCLWMSVLIILVVASMLIVFIPSPNSNDKIFMVPLIIFYPIVIFYIIASYKKLQNILI